MSERAIFGETPKEHKRATPYKTPMVVKRARGVETPILRKRASNEKTPISDKRARRKKTPRAFKRATALKTPIAEERVTVLKTPTALKRAIPLKTPTAVERTPTAPSVRETYRRREMIPGGAGAIDRHGSGGGRGSPGHLGTARRGDQALASIADSGSAGSHRRAITMRIKRARMVMRRAFERDPDFRHGYQANIAMLIYDDQTTCHKTIRPAQDLRTKDGCNAIADRIIDLVFGE